MADNEVSLMVMVNSQGAEKLTDISDKMGKFEKQTSLVSTSTNRGVVANNLYNTSLVKTIPQMQVLTPLMNSLGLGSLMTAGAVGLLGTGLLKVGQTALQEISGIQGLGQVTGQYTSGPLMTYYQTLAEVKKLSDEMYESTNQVSTAFQDLVKATHDEGTAMSLLNEANKVSKDTGESLVTVAKQLADAWSQGVMIGGKAIPPGQGAASALANVMDVTGKNKAGGIMEEIKRSFARFFDPNSSDFLKGFNPTLPGFSLFNPLGIPYPGSNKSTSSLPSLPAVTPPASSSPSAPQSSIGPITNNIYLDSQLIGTYLSDAQNEAIRARGGG